MINGWIKLHRKLCEKGFYKKPDYLALWIHILLKCNHKKEEILWNGKAIVVEPGSFVTGRNALSREIGIHPSKVERILKYFEIEQQIEQQKTTKFRIISVKKWENYQLEENAEQQNEQQVNNKRTTNEQQVNTNKNEKNIKNDKKEDIELKLLSPKNDDLPTLNEIVLIWNSFAKQHNIPEIHSLNNQRKKKLRIRMREPEFNIIKILDAAKDQQFLFGENQRGWTMNFDWIIANDANYIKILEKSYGGQMRTYTYQEAISQATPYTSMHELFDCVEIDGRNCWVDKGNRERYGLKRCGE